MARLRSILLYTAAGASLVLLLATVVLWVRSYAVEEALVRGGPTLVSFDSAHGQLGFSYMNRAGLVWPSFRPAGWYYRGSPPLPSAREFEGPVLRGTVIRFDRLGFSLLYGRRPPYGGRGYGPAIAYPSVFVARLPHWFVAALFAILPIRAFLYRRATPGGPRNRCRVCNYDLRATPDRCPECGAVPV